MSSSFTDESSRPKEGLGFNPSEQSDFTISDAFSASQRPELLKWQYLEGGSRIPLFFKDVPHLHDSAITPKEAVLAVDTDELCRKIAQEATQAQLESVTLKQKADTLQAEKELLDWHLANNSKSKQNQQGIIDTAKTKLDTIKAKIKDTAKSLEASELLNTALVHQVEQMEKNLQEAKTSLVSEEQVFNDMLKRKHNFLADIALERRIADHERLLRFHQWKKLKAVANLDKKHHVKFDHSSNLDQLVCEAYEHVSKFKQLDIAAVDHTLGNARTVFNKQVADIDPLEDFPFSEIVGSPSASQE